MVRINTIRLPSITNFKVKHIRVCDEVKRNINKMIEHLTKVTNMLMIPKAYLIDKISLILR